MWHMKRIEHFLMAFFLVQLSIPWCIPSHVCLCPDQYARKVLFTRGHCTQHYRKVTPKGHRRSSFKAFKLLNSPCIMPFWACRAWNVDIGAQHDLCIGGNLVYCAFTTLVALSFSFFLFPLPLTCLSWPLPLSISLSLPLSSFRLSLILSILLKGKAELHVQTIILIWVCLLISLIHRQSARPCFVMMVTTPKAAGQHTHLPWRAHLVHKAE